MASQSDHACGRATDFGRTRRIASRCCPGLVDLRGNVRKDTRTIRLLHRADVSAVQHSRAACSTGRRSARRSARTSRRSRAPTRRSSTWPRPTPRASSTLGPLPAGDVSRSRADRPELESHARPEREVGHGRRERRQRAAGHRARCDRARFDAAAVSRTSRAIDSVTLRVTFDKPLDPCSRAAAGADSTAARRIRRSSRSRAFSGRASLRPGDRRERSRSPTRCAAPPTRRARRRHAPTAAAASADARRGRRAPPPPPKPRLPAARSRNRRHALRRRRRSAPASYVVTARGMRNLLGQREGHDAHVHRRRSRRRATRPQRARADSARRPPAVPPTRPPPR